jgi:hypothetical protein
MEGAVDFDGKSKVALKQALLMLWNRFRLEYENVSVGDLDGCYVKFLITRE